MAACSGKPPGTPCAPTVQRHPRRAPQPQLLPGARPGINCGIGFQNYSCYEANDSTLPNEGSGQQSTAAPVSPQTSKTEAITPVVPVPIVIPAGAQIQVKLDQALDVRRYHAGDPFSGALQSGQLGGALVSGTVTTVNQSRGFFKAGSVLSFRLDSVTIKGRVCPIQTFAFVDFTGAALPVDGVVIPLKKTLPAGSIITLLLKKDMTICQ